jgi:hypothetical protein
MKKDVYVVSGADKVELFLNGKSLGLGTQSNRFLFTFLQVEWQPGTLKAIGFNAAGREICTAERQTAGEPVAVKLTPITAPTGLKADGADVVLVEFEVVDSKGRRCPTALNLVQFELEGPAEWRGGIAQGPDNFILSKSLPVECGVNRVLIRSTAQPGKVVLKARTDGLKPAQIEMASRAVTVDGGLATALPGADLPVRLDRGPTPETPSFRITRVAVPIAGATAGANAAAASATFDDNELTVWTNDNKVATGWIEYQFARAATPNEITMKLRGWRERSYPLRITVEGREVFTGTTPRSLGYVTIPLKPVTGRTLKLELVGTTRSVDGFNITELENSQDDTTGDTRARNGSLGIVEFECYEAERLSEIGSP